MVASPRLALPSSAPAARLGDEARLRRWGQAARRGVVERSNGSGTDPPDRDKAKKRNGEREQGEAAAKVGGEVVTGQPDIVAVEQAKPDRERQKADAHESNPSRPCSGDLLTSHRSPHAGVAATPLPRGCVAESEAQLVELGRISTKCVSMADGHVSTVLGAGLPQLSLACPPRRLPMAQAATARRRSARRNGR